MYEISSKSIFGINYGILFKVTSKSQSHVNFITEKTLYCIDSTVCAINVWAYFTAYDTKQIVPYRGSLDIKVKTFFQ